MTLTGSVKTCFRKYAKFSGRAPRSEYWKFWLFYILLMIGLVIANGLITGPEVIVQQRNTLTEDGATETVTFEGLRYSSGWFGTIFTLLVFFPGLSVASRRLQDTGINGKWAVLPLVVFLSGAVVVGLHLFATGIVSPWYMLVSLATILSGAAILFLCAVPSQPGPNKYGPNPQEVRP